MNDKKIRRLVQVLLRCFAIYGQKGKEMIVLISDVLDCAAEAGVPVLDALKAGILEKLPPEKCFSADVGTAASVAEVEAALMRGPYANRSKICVESWAYSATKDVAPLQVWHAHPSLVDLCGEMGVLCY